MVLWFSDDDEQEDVVDCCVSDFAIAIEIVMEKG